MTIFRTLRIALCLLATTGLARAQAPLPQVISAWEWNVAPRSAGLSLQGEAAGLAAYAWFELSTSPGLADSKVAGAREFPASPGRFEVHIPLAGLEPGTTYYYQAKVRTWAGETESEVMTFSTPPDAAPRPAVRFHRFTGNGWEFECDPHGARGWCAVFMGAAPDRVTRLVDAIVLRGEPTARRVAVHEQHLSPRLQQRYYLQAVIATAGGITPSEVLLAQPLPGHRSLEARLAGQDSDWMEPVRAREVISPPEPRWRGDDDISPPSPDPSPAPALVPPDYPVPPARHSSGNGTGCPPAP